MTEVNPIDGLGLIELSGEIVSAYVGHNSVSVADLPKLIADVHAALQRLTIPTPPEASLSPTPAVSIRKSVTPDFIVCLDDGKKFKSMKRHLSQLGMTPDQYRSKWGLPSDYPDGGSQLFGCALDAGKECWPRSKTWAAAPQGRAGWSENLERQERLRKRRPSYEVLSPC